MAKTIFLLGIISLISFFSITFAFDPRPLQDFCVADFSAPVRMNGIACKDPETVQASDFFFSGLHIPGNTSNVLGAALTSVSVVNVPGLNTLGLSMARLDLAPGGFILPHHHHRATEILTVLEGSLEVGFVTSYPKYMHLSKVLVKGDVFVVPIGLLHYQRAVGNENTVVLAAVNSQNAGIVETPKGIFGAKPKIDSDYLSKSFGLDKKIVEDLQAKFTS